MPRRPTAKAGNHETFGSATEDHSRWRVLGLRLEVSLAAVLSIGCGAAAGAMASRATTEPLAHPVQGAGHTQHYLHRLDVELCRHRHLLDGAPVSATLRRWHWRQPNR